jgi:hypothetical protein
MRPEMISGPVWEADDDERPSAGNKGGEQVPPVQVPTPESAFTKFQK